MNFNHNTELMAEEIALSVDSQGMIHRMMMYERGDGGGVPKLLIMIFMI